VTGEQLASLPPGSLVKLDNEHGTILTSGATVSINWHESELTNFVDTKSVKWKSFISWLEAV
jgi:hypothetical protein